MTRGPSKDAGETIFQLIEKPKKQHLKSPRYVSIHSGWVREEISRRKSAHRTLGEARTSLPPPSAYLRKGSGFRHTRPRSEHVHYRRPGYQHELPDWKAVQKPAPEPLIPPLPRDPGCSLAGGIDFRRKNICEAGKAKRRGSRSPRIVDSPRGHTIGLRSSGWMPVYVHKKTFGKVPEKIYYGSTTKIQNESKGTGERDVKKSDAKNKSGCKYITEDERENLLQNMKKKWSELMKQYQCLPFVTDTAPKIKRKASLEDKLKQLEKDIELIDNHQYIYVYDD
ncbi:hypothetical protein QAD02_008887 [Eretmocerus hayati]|uniref:Uncharacterized protein n=1 Tax=Eretmocerus hayati TaxID=131215 RepID=A0ACC2N7Q0_9HYME|nr:hypothetical protein QAD02_008887 [Eretmocerus hayati]